MKDCIRTFLGCSLAAILLVGALPSSFGRPAPNPLDPQNSVGGGAVGAAGGTSANVLGLRADASVQVAPVTLPAQGGSFTNQVVSVNATIPGVLASTSAGVIIDTTAGSVTQSSAHAQSSSTVNQLNVLGGLVTASVIVSSAASDGNGHSATSSSAGSSAADLSIAGVLMGQAEFAPNSRIPVSGTVLATVAGATVGVPVTGSVTINEQTFGGDGVTTSSLNVNFLHISVSGSVAGLISISHDEVVASASSSVSFTAPSSTGNHPPVVNVPGPQNVSVGNTLTFTVSASDPDAGDTVRLTATGLPPGAAFAPNPATGNPVSGQFTFAPAQGQAGQTFTATFTATDSHGASSSANVQISVSTAGNHPPVLNVPGPQTVSVGNTLTFNVSASDPDTGDIVRLSAGALPPGATFTPNPASGNPVTGELTFTPIQSQVGQTFNATFAATDSHGGAAAAAVQISVTQGSAPDQSQAPVISVPGPQVIGVGQTLKFGVVAIDPGMNPITLSAVGVPPNAVFDPPSGIFTFTPKANQVGQVYVVTFTATDSNGLSSNGSVQITVIMSSTSGKPVISVPGSPITVRVGDPLDFPVSATSPAGCPAPITASGIPAGASFDPASGRFSFIPTPDQKGQVFVVAFKATDCNGQSSTATVTILVVDPNPNPDSGRVCTPAAQITFGPTPVNACCGFVTFSLSNFGSGPLTISSLSLLDGGNFSVDGAPGLPAVLQPGGSFQLRIGFQPKTVGMLHDTLTISTSDANRPTVTIDLKGRGVK
jgi:hypothetical protein